MVDTARTKADLLTNIFQDGQAVNSITANDMRDLIVSLATSQGSGRFISPAGIDINSTTVFEYPSSGTSALINNTADIDMPQNGRIRYIGIIDKMFIINISITAIVEGNNQDLRFQLTKNGVPMIETITARSWGTGTDSGNLSISTGTLLAPNDYIEIQAANDTSTSNITIQNGVITLHGNIA